MSGLRPVLIIAAASLLSCSSTSFRTQEVDWFKSGYYAGAMVGKATLNVSASDIDSDLADEGYSTSTMFENDDTAWNVFGGYRFQDPYAIEVALVDLGQVESTIGASPPDLNQFLEDVSDVHPFLGQGISITGRWFVVDQDRLELSLAGGVWLWKADVEVIAATGETVDIDETGLDLTFGATGTYAVDDNLDLRLSWDRMYLDGESADVFWIGFQGGLSVIRSKNAGVN